VTDFGLNQINSNDSNDSIFSITQDDLFYDDDDDGEIERLSEFEAVSRLARTRWSGVVQRA
jgi:hypothetical protein